MNNKKKEDTVTLEILQVIDSKKDVTQRHLASRLDVALGLANSYLKRCVHKGLIKIQQAPANRYFYYLTPKGFSEYTGRIITGKSFVPLIFNVILITKIPYLQPISLNHTLYFKRWRHVVFRNVPINVRQ